MHPLAARRARAHLTDCVGYLGVAVATVPVGIVLATTELSSSELFSHLISAVPPAIATVIAARAESGPRRATWGKRREELEVAGAAVADGTAVADGAAAAVAADGAALSFGRALLRNTAKIFVPWQLGHIVAVGAAWGGFEEGDALTFVASFAVYAVIGLYAWTTLRGSGRGVHDLLADSRVTAVVTTRA